MLRHVIVVAGAALLSGCGDLLKPKVVSVCEDILKEVVLDPAGLKINSQEVIESPASVDDLYRLYDEQSENGISEAARALVDIYRQRGVQFTEVFVVLDSTYELKSGRQRDKAMCKYLEYEGTVELASFTIAGQHFDRSDFFAFFLTRRRPDDMDEMFQLK